MSTPKHGGPAFPYAFQHDNDNQLMTEGFSAGMTLRAYLAGQALPSAIEAHQRGFIAGAGPKMIAMTSVEMADALIAELSKPQSTKS